MVDSCALHDLQSVFRLPCSHYIGQGGLDNQNAIQLFHMLWSLWDNLNASSQWKKTVHKIWKQLHASKEMPALVKSCTLPDGIGAAMQQPLITRWWTIGTLSKLASKFLPFFVKVAQAIRNTCISSHKLCMISSNMLSLASSEGIVVNVHFLAGFANCWLNPHMKFMQGTDPNIGTPGYLSFHRAGRYYLQVRDLENIRDNWRAEDSFARLKEAFDKLPTERQTIMDKMICCFANVAILQAHKHNNRYVMTSKIARAIFGEQPLGQVVARFLSKQQGSLMEPIEYKSAFHGTSINLQKFHKWLETIGTTTCTEAFVRYPIKQIVEG